MEREGEIKTGSHELVLFSFLEGEPISGICGVLEDNTLSTDV